MSHTSTAARPASPATQLPERPTRAEAEAAVRVLLRWAGDDPAREGLLDTPKRVAEAFEEYFSGYGEDPHAVLAKTFEEVEGYDDLVLLKGMRFESHCEHHIAPIIGVAHIAYLPDRRVVGISKIARLLDVYARRLQTQETMTAQIANTMDQVMRPRGVAVFIDAAHECMTTRGVHKPGTTTVTTTFTGVFREQAEWRDRFLRLIGA